jgi:hypothetical protein
MNLFIFGLGYSAGHFARIHGGSFSHIAGSVRDPAPRNDLAGIELHAFAGSRPSQETIEQVRGADVLLVSIPPGGAGDPAIAAFGEVLATGRRKIVYLSTIGVYGDHGGGWVDENTPPQSTLERARLRVAAEQAWIDVARGDGRAECDDGSRRRDHGDRLVHYVPPARARCVSGSLHA